MDPNGRRREMAENRNRQRVVDDIVLNSENRVKPKKKNGSCFVRAFSASQLWNWRKSQTNRTAGGRQDPSPTRGMAGCIVGSYPKQPDRGIDVISVVRKLSARHCSVHASAVFRHVQWNVINSNSISPNPDSRVIIRNNYVRLNVVTKLALKVTTVHIRNIRGVS